MIQMDLISRRIERNLQKEEDINTIKKLNELRSLNGRHKRMDTEKQDYS